MSIVIFGDLFTFPDGSAATNRVYTYAKGFNENGISVHVVCFYDEYLEEHTGVINDIHYYHPLGQKKRNKHFIIRRWYKLRKYFKAILLINRINKQDKITAINSYTESLLNYLFSWFLAKICKAKLIMEICEHPLRFYQIGIIKKKIGLIKLYIESRLCDGIFCISRFLVNFYRNQGIHQRKLFLVPSMVDPGRFLKTAEKPIPFRYIGYFGSLTFERDNVDLLIRTFARITGKYDDVSLVLGGFCSENEKKQIKDLITQLNIDSKVQLLEYLTRQEIIAYITHAHILVMVRSNDLRSQASFPSKLFEFLATSNPVVTVNTGEISDYLTDALNVFIVEPGNCDALTEKLEFILSNYEFAQSVAQRGKELTATIFNYNYQTKRMIGFINSLNNISNTG